MKPEPLNSMVKLSLQDIMVSSVPNSRALLMTNQAIARGAIEAAAQVVAGCGLCTQACVFRAIAPGSSWDGVPMEANMDLVVAGVGGQGNLLISRIIGETALRSGIDVKISETFGAAQRGAAVLSLVRLGENQSPTIPFGKADALLALEPAEALRQSSTSPRGDWRS